MPRKSKKVGPVQRAVDALNRQSSSVRALLFVAVFGVIGGGGYLAYDTFAAAADVPGSAKSVTRTCKSGAYTMSVRYGEVKLTNGKYRVRVEITSPVAYLDYRVKVGDKYDTGAKRASGRTFVSANVYDVSRFTVMEAWAGIDGDGKAMCPTNQIVN